MSFTANVSAELCDTSHLTGGSGVGGLGGCNSPPGLLRGKQKQAKTVYLVRCEQVATYSPPPLPPFNKILEPPAHLFKGVGEGGGG